MKNTSEKTGTIYTIEYDAEGCLKSVSSRPAPLRTKRSFGSGRQNLVLYGYICTFLCILGILLERNKRPQLSLMFLILGMIVFLLATAVLLRELSARGHWIEYREYLEDWIIDQKKQRGYRYHEDSGCYVITTYRRPLGSFDDVLNYENVYVGQSIHVYQRVYNHFIGRGSGEIYGDIKYGWYVYVRIVPCRKKDLNDKERELIARYRATDSYNRTQGGATIR